MLCGMRKTKKSSTKNRPTYSRWFLKEWRKHRGLTLEQLAEMIESTAASVSRLERSLQPYSQTILENLAEALRCRPADLIARAPSEADDIAAVLSGMSPPERRRVLAVARVLKDEDEAA